MNAHLNSLHATVLAQKTRITKVNTNLNGFFGCLYEAPVTEYGDPSGTFGYLWTDDGNPADAYATSGFDYTNSGNIPDFWAFVDNCSRNTPARVGQQTLSRGGYSTHLLAGSRR